MRVIIRRTSVSEGARALANALREAGVTVLLSGRGRFRRPGLILNWGSTVPIEDPDTLNYPVAVADARNKMDTFVLLENDHVSIPRYWVDKEIAEQERGKSIILERHTVTGQSGAGIVVKRNGQPLDDAPLYVEYIKKDREFRVHVFGGNAIAIQEKKRESDAEQTADQKLIRNHANGWVFCVNDVARPEGLGDLGVSACHALELDFGAVDIIQAKDGKLYVLEVNTRPGLESPTVLAAYVSAIKKRIGHNGDEGDS